MMLRLVEGFREKVNARHVVAALVWFVVAAGSAGCIPDTQTQPIDVATMLTTAELRQMLGNPGNLKGIQYNRAVGMAFQEKVLENLPGPKFTYANGKRFESEERKSRTNARIEVVIHDGVAGAVEGSPSPLPPLITTYPESTFMEVKAVHGVIDLKYAGYQILGMLDALSKSQAASSQGPRRAYPSLYFVVTGDTRISEDIPDLATRLKILVWISGVVRVSTSEFQVSPPRCLNCVRVLPDNTIPSILFGTPFRLPKLGSGGPDSLDAPILDDRLVGHPGIPGDTSPNR